MADEPKIVNGVSTGVQKPRYWFAQNSKSVIFLIMVIALVGAYLAFTIPVSVFPSTDFPRIVVGIENGVMPIDQMLVTVTRPVEQAVNSVPGLQSVRSITSRGSAEVDLFFNWNVDMFQTLQLVDSALARIETELPPGTKIDTHRLTFASFPILGYSLTGDNVPQTQLWEMATYDIAPRLNRLGGVATVVVQGGQVPEFQITPDPAKLLATSITVTDILNAVQATNVIDSPGLFERNHQLVLGLVTGQVHTPEELARVVIKSTQAGIPVRIGDIGTVARSIRPVYTIVRAEGNPAVLMNISRQPNSNTVEVAREVNAEVESIRKSLPPGIHLTSFYDQSGIVRDSIKSVRDAILIGLVLSSLVLIIFLRDWGTSLVAGLVIPVTILVTFIVLKLMGQTFNLMTLGGLAAAVGLVIDDAIVVVENVVLHRDAGEGRLEAIHSALSEITVPLIGSTLTPIVVFLPLISITGVTGTFFRALAVTMSAALLTSLVLALSWTPTLSQFFIRRKKPAVEAIEPLSAAESLDIDQEMRRLMAAEEASMQGFFGRVIAFYERWLRRALEHPRWLAAGCGLLVVIAGAAYFGLETGLLPEMDEGGFVVDYLTPPGTSLQETDRIVSHIEKILHDIPEVESTSRRTGLQLGLAAVTEANNGDISVKLKSDRSRGVEEIIAEVRSSIAKQEPAADIEITQVLQDMIGDLTSAPEPVVIKLFSNDGKLLEQAAPRVADAISKISGVVDLKDGIEDSISGPATTFNVKPTVAAKSGFTTEEVSTDAQAILQGVPAAAPLVANQRAYTIRVRFPEQDRASLEAMSNTLLTSASGHTATLGALADITEDPGQTEIRRENLQRDVEVTARLEGVGLGGGIARVKQAVANLHLPSSIRVEYGGTYQEQQKSFHDLVIVLVLAIILVFTVLLFEFRSFSAPTAILSSALLSTSGVFLALLITNTTFNVASFMGVIMVVGIVAKNGILLLDAHQKFEHAGFAREEAMLQAGRRRLRPIVMTALASVAGMLPLAFALGAGSQMLQPLAIAVIGGILISMVLSLIVTPAVFFYLGKH
ncbi:MAG TPA: efflux RND transporter permease subunit [Candidatus Acidoferrales bacterium]|jgi:multidrug efflux pump subunit AcrB|nr:efflux RND transporter permease subunit [Candidatus Acidoferrales bacterium]